MLITLRLGVRPAKEVEEHVKRKVRAEQVAGSFASFVTGLVKSMKSTLGERATQSVPTDGLRWKKRLGVSVLRSVGSLLAGARARAFKVCSIGQTMVSSNSSRSRWKLRTIEENRLTHFANVPLDDL